MRGGSRALLGATLAFTAALGAPAAESPASHSAFEVVSIGNGAEVTQFAGASYDGLRVFTRTWDTLTASDTDTRADVYEHAGGATTQVSIGPAGGNGPYGSVYEGSSADGSRVFFTTADPLVASDTDECDPTDPAPNGCGDVYERSGGSTTLLSTGPVTPSTPFFAGYLDASEDGLRVFFSTREAMVGGDSDTLSDVYERSGGTTTLVSTGPAGGNGDFIPAFGDASADGTSVFFTTGERLVASDTDSAADVYARESGTTTLVSTGPAGGNGAADATFRAVSHDGSRVIFETSERLVSADTDGATDVYERAGGATTLLSTGPAGGNGSAEALYKDSSDGGTRVFFQTTESLTSSDGDGQVDVYERSGGTTTHVSTGPADDGPFDATLQGVSRDGARVVFGTTESVTGADTDGRFDIYERAGGSTTLLSVGPAGGNGPVDAFLGGMSEDGRRVFFESAEQLTSDDTDSFTDVYEREGAVTTRLSKGPDGDGNGGWLAVYVGASADGSRVFFSSAENLASADTDVFSDLYMASATTTYARPKAASPLRVSLVIAYGQCTAPNRVHGPPALGGGTTDASCSPPAPASDHLTVGTPDSNGQTVKSVGEAEFRAIAGDPGTSADEADAGLRVSIIDVRRRNDLADYAGELAAGASVRITDKYNGTVPADSATVSDIPFPFTVPCATTTNSTVGSTCAVDTTGEALVPGAIKEKARTIWELGQVELRDGGPDGNADTDPNTVFARQGVFIP